MISLIPEAGWCGRFRALRCPVRNQVSVPRAYTAGDAVQHRPTTIRDRLGALRGLLRISDDDYNAYMRSYGELFVDSPENTRADYEAGVALRGYPQGSSNELTELYKVIHLLCTLGSVEKMYMPPQIDPAESVLQNQILFERIVAEDLNLTPGEKVLELGCGCGAIAEHIAELTGATPYGVNLDSSQIEKAWGNPNPPQANFQTARCSASCGRVGASSSTMSPPWMPTTATTIISGR